MGGGGGGELPETLVRGVGLVSNPFTLIMSEICDFPYPRPIYYLSNFSIPYFLDHTLKINTLFETWLVISSQVQLDQC